MSMSFNTALSGLNASSTDLSVIGNNIANANTTGFKFSRTEFADLYSASLRTYSGARIGSGVKVTGVVQQFTQGNANTTDQSLDLAISGDGFFRVTDSGSQNPLFTRNGAFHIDKNNDVVNAQGQYLNVYQADTSTGEIIGSIDKLHVDQSDIDPSPTTSLSAVINLNSAEAYPKATDTLTVKGLRLNAKAAIIPNDPPFNSAVPSTYNSKTSTTIYDSKGISHTASMYFVNTGELDANNDIVWTVHTVVDNVNGVQGGVEVFPAFAPNDPNFGTNPPTLAKVTFNSTTGAIKTQNPLQLTFNNIDGISNHIQPDPGLINPINNANPINFTINLDNAIQTAGENIDTLGLNSASTAALDTAVPPGTTLPVGAFNPADPLTYDSNVGVITKSIGKDSLGVDHNATLYFVSKGYGSREWDMHAFVDARDAGGNLVNAPYGQEVFLDSNNPSPIKVFANMDGTLRTQPDQFQYTIQNPGGLADPLKFSLNGLQNKEIVNPTLNANGNVGKIWTDPAPGSLPTPASYDYTTSTTIYDSQGGSHLTSFYFVKTGSKLWDVHTFVDGAEIKEPNGTGSPMTLEFDSNGTLNTTYPPPATPADLGKIKLTAVMNNGAANIDFTMDLGNENGKITQYGSPSGVSAITQDGYATGHISSINVANDGTVSSLFTNGHSRTLGQVAMFNFANIQGLRPVGNTEWAQTSTSGTPVPGTPGGPGNMGTIQSGALESSNVDLTKQLVDMIVSQRSFQANAQVISAVDTLTQTIVNLR
ncbi:Flagellar hook protein FlgE [Gammaproteobacteria bacterium]